MIARPPPTETAAQKFVRWVRAPRLPLGACQTCLGSGQVVLSDERGIPAGMATCPVCKGVAWL